MLQLLLPALLLLLAVIRRALGYGRHDYGLVELVDGQRWVAVDAAVVQTEALSTISESN